MCMNDKYEINQTKCLKRMDFIDQMLRVGELTSKIAIKTKRILRIRWT